MFIHSLADEHTAIIVTRFTDLQSADALHTQLPVLGVVCNGNLVLYPLNLGLQEKEGFM